MFECILFDAAEEEKRRKERLGKELPSQLHHNFTIYNNNSQSYYHYNLDNKLRVHYVLWFILICHALYRSFFSTPNFLLSSL
jgi:hypothetical protein